MAKMSDAAVPSLLFTETDDASIGTPAAGKRRLFCDTDNIWKDKDEAGTVTAVGGGGGSGTPLDGWVDDTAETWTRTAATTFTVPGDLTAKYTTGTRLKLTQTTVKYFVVVSSSHAAGTTTVTVTGGSDYTLAAAAITANYHSYAANPEGYPGWFNFTTGATGYSAFTNNLGRFAVNGRVCTLLFNISGTSNATTATATAPIAASASTMTATCGFLVINAGAVPTHPGRAQINAGSATVTFLRDWQANAWTASGDKATQHVVLTYEI